MSYHQMRIVSRTEPITYDEERLSHGNKCRTGNSAQEEANYSILYQSHTHPCRCNAASDERKPIAISHLGMLTGELMFRITTERFLNPVKDRA
jgi:hypothetical protein